MTLQEELDEIWRHALEAQASGDITFEQLKDVACIILDAELEAENV